MLFQWRAPAATARNAALHALSYIKCRWPTLDWEATHWQCQNVRWLLFDVVNHHSKKPLSQSWTKARGNKNNGRRPTAAFHSLFLGSVIFESVSLWLLDPKAVLLTWTKIDPTCLQEPVIQAMHHKLDPWRLNPWLSLNQLPILRFTEFWVALNVTTQSEKSWSTIIHMTMSMETSHPKATHASENGENTTSIHTILNHGLSRSVRLRQ